MSQSVGEQYMTLTKDKLATRLQTEIGMTKPESLELVDGLFELMKSTLADGEDLLISGFGKFSVRQKKERLGRNPQTKEKLMLRARKVVTFRASGVLRERVNE
jgi:integration host factor subunit alpha